MLESKRRWARKKRLQEKATALGLPPDTDLSTWQASRRASATPDIDHANESDLGSGISHSQSLDSSQPLDSSSSAYATITAANTSTSPALASITAAAPAQPMLGFDHGPNAPFNMEFGSMMGNGYLPQMPLSNSLPNSGPSTMPSMPHTMSNIGPGPQNMCFFPHSGPPGPPGPPRAPGPTAAQPQSNQGAMFGTQNQLPGHNASNHHPHHLLPGTQHMGQNNMQFVPNSLPNSLPGHWPQSHHHGYSNLSLSLGQQGMSLPAHMQSNLQLQQSLPLSLSDPCLAGLPHSNASSLPAFGHAGNVGPPPMQSTTTTSNMQPSSTMPQPNLMLPNRDTEVINMLQQEKRDMLARMRQRKSGTPITTTNSSVLPASQQSKIQQVDHHASSPQFSLATAPQQAAMAPPSSANELVDSTCRSPPSGSLNNAVAKPPSALLTLSQPTENDPHSDEAADAAVQLLVLASPDRPQRPTKETNGTFLLTSCLCSTLNPDFSFAPPPRKRECNA